MTSTSDVETSSTNSVVVTGAVMPSGVGPYSGHQITLRPMRSQDFTSNRAIVQAWDAHLQKLTELEKNMFRQYEQGNIDAYIKNINSAIQGQREKSWTRKIANFLEPIFVTARKYMPVANTAVQADPMPSALVLAGIVCVMEISSGFILYQEKLVAVLSRMGQKANILTELSDNVYQDDEQVQLALLEVYGDILNFCREALKLLVNERGEIRSSRKVFGSSLLKPFDESTFGKIEQNFKRHLETFRDRAEASTRKVEAAHRKEQHNVGQNILYMQSHIQNNTSISRETVSQLHQLQIEEVRERERKAQVEKKRSILNWLPSTSFENTFDEKYESRVDGTGRWLFCSSEYKSWKTSSKSAALWIKGKNGCGKSVLASVALTEIRETHLPGTAVAYFFCSSLQEKTSEQLELLGSLLRQLCEQLSTIDGVMEEIFDQRALSHSTGPSRQETTKLLNFVVTKFSTVFLVCDGLDECRDQEKISECLLSLSQMDSATVKVLLFSRPNYETLEEVFEGCPLLYMDNGANDEDIKSYITKTLHGRRIAAKDEKQLHNTRKEIFNKAEGMFLWVHLLSRTLIGSRTLNQLQEKLKSIPRGLDKVYELSVQRIFDEPDAEKRKWALNMLFWTTNAKRRLTRSEMVEAIVIEIGMKDLDDGDRITFDNGLTTLCGDLVRLDNEECYDLVHSSLRDYLLSIPSSGFSPLEEYRLRQVNADYVMAGLCLTYLLFSKFRNRRISSQHDLNEFLKENPFFSYAVTNFGKRLSVEAEEKLRGLILELLDCTVLRDLVLQVMHGKLPSQPGEATQLILLSAFNLTETAKSLPESESQRNVRGPFKLYPLDYTFINGSREMCLWLLGIDNETVRSLLLPLHSAASLDWADVLDKLLPFTENVDARDTNGQTPLLVAARKGSAQAVDRLLKKANINVDSMDKEGETPLMGACRANHTDLVLKLLEVGATVTIHNQSGWTALHIAAAQNNVEMTRMLLEFGADIEAQATGSNNWTPLSIAAGVDSTDVIQFLNERGAKMEVTGDNGSTPLHAAVWNGSIYSTEILVRLKANVETADKVGKLPLSKAAIAGHLDILKVLLKESPMTIDSTDDSQETALHHAAYYGHRDVVAYLLETGAKVDLSNNNGETALHLAISRGYTSIAELLLKAGSDPDRANNYNDSIVHVSSRLERADFIKQILQYAPGLNINLKNNFGQTPLHIAAKNGRSDTVKFLLELRAEMTGDINDDLPLHLAAAEGHQDVVFLFKESLDACGFHGRTALYVAAEHGHLDLVQSLLDTGANVNILDYSGFHLIFAPLKGNHLGVLHLLLKRGLSANVALPDGWTLLHEAARAESADAVRAILAAGGNASALTNMGISPLCIAIEYANLGVVELLHEAAPEAIHIPSIDGTYPIHMAAFKGDLHTLNKIIQLGSDPKVCDNYGNNSLYFAAVNGNVELADRLIKLGVDANGSDSEYMDPPLCVAACHGNMELVLWMIDFVDDIDCSDSLSGTTPLIWASAQRRPKVVDILLAAGADPFRRDLFGLNAIDYATRHAATLEKFAAFMPYYKPIDGTAQRTTISKTIIRALQLLLNLPEEPKPVVQSLRLKFTGLLSQAFLNSLDSDMLDFSRMCFIASSPSKEKLFFYNRSCVICNIFLTSGEYYRCCKCHDISLCSECYTSYLKGWKTPRSAPEGFRRLESLEKVLRKAILPLRYLFSVLDNGLTFCITWFPSVVKWLDQKSKAYEEWETAYNEQGVYQQRQRPGQEFLKLFEEKRKLERSHSTESATREDTEPALALDKKFDDFFRRFRADQDFQDFVCSGHEFMKISYDEQKELQGNGDLDVDGQLAKRWLRQMLARFENLNAELNEDRLSKAGGSSSGAAVEIGTSDEPVSLDKESLQRDVEQQTLSTVQAAMSSIAPASTTLEEAEVRTTETAAEGILNETSGESDSVLGRFLEQMILILAEIMQEDGVDEFQEDLRFFVAARAKNAGNNQEATSHQTAQDTEE